MGLVLLNGQLRVKDILNPGKAKIIIEKDLERENRITVEYPELEAFQEADFIYYKEMLYKLVIKSKDYNTATAEGEAFYYTLGTDQPKTLNFESVSPEFALEQALDGTDWEVGEVELTNLRTTKAKDETTLEILSRIEGVFGGELNFRVTMGKQGIESLKVDLLERLGGEKGHRYEVGYNIQDYSHEVDLSSVVTALLPRGESKDLDEDGDPVPFGIDDISWSKENGDPVDKPSGQSWIGDPEALEKYGNVDKDGNKVHIFKVYDSEAQTPEALIESSWNALQRRNKPSINTEANVIDLDTENPVELGDTVAVIFKNERLQARVIRTETHETEPENNTVEIGEFRKAITEELEEVRRKNLELKRKEGVYNRSALFEMEEQETGTEYNLDIGEKNIVITGDSNFYWDGSGLFAINPEDIQNYIRFDKEGLRFTEDGGENWTLAVGYDGLNVEDSDALQDLQSQIDVNSEAIDLRVTQENYNEDQEDVSDAIENLESGQTDITGEVSSLSGEISTQADEISAVVSRVEANESQVSKNESDITALDDEINLRVSEEIEDYDEGIREHISSQITQGIDSIDFDFEEAKGDIDGLKEDMDTINTSFSFTPDYFEITRSGSDLKMRLDESKMRFMDGSEEVATISNRRMNITKGNFTRSLRIGNHVIERYNDEITLVKWEGGD